MRENRNIANYHWGTLHLYMCSNNMSLTISKIDAHYYYAYVVIVSSTTANAVMSKGNCKMDKRTPKGLLSILSYIMLKHNCTISGTISSGRHWWLYNRVLSMEWEELMIIQQSVIYGVGVANQNKFYSHNRRLKMKPLEMGN